MVNYKDAINIPQNAILPFDVRRYKLALGSAEYIAIEVIISKLIRTLLKVNTKSWVELATVHAVSLSYMGGAAGFTGPPGSLEDTFTNQLIDLPPRGVSKQSFELSVSESLRSVQ